MEHRSWHRKGQAYRSQGSRHAGVAVEGERVERAVGEEAVGVGSSVWSAS